MLAESQIFRRLDSNGCAASRYIFHTFNTSLFGSWWREFPPTSLMQALTLTRMKCVRNGFGFSSPSRSLSPLGSSAPRLKCRTRTIGRNILDFFLAILSAGKSLSILKLSSFRIREIGSFLSHSCAAVADHMSASIHEFHDAKSISALIDQNEHSPIRF